MRKFSMLGKADPQAVDLVNGLSLLKNDPTKYRTQMFLIGNHLADAVFPQLRDATSQICVICTVEDADFLARGVIERLEENGLSDRIRLICLWNGKIKEEGVSLSPILKEYQEKISSGQVDFIVVKSIISGACVVKTNLTRAISVVNPSRIFVTAPVMLSGAEDRLAHEFPSEISERFEFIHFADDNEKNGDDVIPGIGGSVYELLGLGNSVTKNRYTPMLVKERRIKHFGAADLAIA